MGANFNFYATVTNVAESITNNIVNNYYAPVAAMAPSAKEQVLLPATEVCPVEEHNDSKASVAKVTSGRGRGARKKADVQEPTGSPQMGRSVYSKSEISPYGRYDY